VDMETEEQGGKSNLNESSRELHYDPSKLDESPDSKLTDWAKEPTIAELKADLEYAREENTNHKTNVDGWLALRNTTGAESGVKGGKKQPGRSSIQPKMIRKSNEWRYPALSEPFLNTERMFQVNPRTFEDGEAAKQNQILLNWQFDTKLNKVDFIDRYVRTVVDEGTVIVRVGWDNKTEKVTIEKPVYDYFEVEDEQQMEMLQQAIQMYEADDPGYERLPEDLQASVEYSLENEDGIMVIAQETGTEKVTEDVLTYNQPSVKIVDSRNLFIDPSCDGQWQDAQFMVFTYETTKADLKKRKIFKNLDQVNWESNAVKSKLGDPDHETNSPSNDTRVNKEKQMVVVHEYWGLSDIHDNEETVPILVSFIGDTIIQMTENPFPDRKPPFIIVPYMPVLMAHYGEADASLLQDAQRITGAVTRGVIDLLGRSANAQQGYAKGFLDPVNKRRFNSGEDFEFNPNGDPRGMLQQLKYPEIPNSAFQVLQQQNQEAEGLSGIKSFSSGITGESYGQVAKGIAAASDAAGQREVSILRRLAEGMKLIGIKITAMNSKFLSDEETVRVTNDEFVDISRESIQGNFDMVVDISTAKVDEERAQDLGYMLQTMGPDMDPGLSQIIISEIADLKRMPTLAEKIRNYQPQPDPMQQEMQKLEMEKMKADIELDKARAMEAQARAKNTNLDTELDAQGVKHSRDVEKQAAQAGGNRDLEVAKGILKGDTPAGNIEAAVGYNKLIDGKDDVRPPIPPGQPSAEELLMQGQQPQVLPNQQLGPLQSV